MQRKPHRITDVDPQKRVGHCSVCGPNIRVKQTYGKKFPNAWRCLTAHAASQRPYRHYRKDHCERCGLIPEHRAQLHVDHIDENHKNNDPANLQTLCANCHAWKTWCHRSSNEAKYQPRYKPNFHRFAKTTEQ